MSSLDWPSDPHAASTVEAFERRFEREPEVLVRAPGRVALLGAHVDRAEGVVLTAAIDRAVWLAAAPSAEPRLRVTATDLDEEAEIAVAPAPSPDDPGAAEGWTAYPRAVAWSLADSGHLVPGLDAVFGGDLPREAGLSSSAAVEVAFTIAWEALGRFVLPRLDRALIGVRAENRFLGVQSGPMDQCACLLGAPDQFVRFDCRSQEFDRLPVRPGLALLIADSGTRRELATSKFNERRAECRDALDRLRQSIPGLHSLRDLSPDQLSLLGPGLGETLHRRVRHVVEEIERVRAGTLALREGDLTAFGDLVRRSHVSSRDLFESSTDELDTLAEAAWEETACFGARFMGGGFGGVVAALVDASQVDRVADTIGRRFERAHGHRPTFHTCRIGAGADVWGAAAWVPQPAGA